jgi:hypothetical protein
VLPEAYRAAEHPSVFVRGTAGRVTEAHLARAGAASAQRHRCAGHDVLDGVPWELAPQVKRHEDDGVAVLDSHHGADLRSAADGGRIEPDRRSSASTTRKAPPSDMD